MTAVSMKVNGRTVRREVEGRTLLVELLRDELGLTGTHVGCDTSQCGACQVQVDGLAVKACTVFAADLEGAEVRTIEGMANADGSARRDPGGVPGASRPAVRLLHAGHGDDRGLRCCARTPTRARPRSATICRATSAAAPATTTSSRRSRPRRRNCRPARRRGVTPAATRLRTSTEENDRPHGRRDTRETTMPMDGGIGASTKRREDVRFLTGKGRYTDDINRPRQLHVHFLRSDVAHGRIRSVNTRAAARMPGVVRIFTGEDFKDVGGIPCGWQVTDRFGQPMQEPRHPVLAQGKVRHVGDPDRRGRRAQPRPGARRRRGDRARHRGAARRRRHARGARRRARRRSTTISPRTCASTGASSRTTRPRWTRRSRRASRHHARADQQPAGGEPDGAARGDRRVRRRGRAAHALHDLAEPARDPAADGRLRARHPRAQAAGGGARRRRRLRLEDLPLRRGGLRHLRRQGARAAGEVDLDRARRRSCPTPRAATTSPGSSSRSTRTASSSRSAPTRWPTWARTCRPSRAARRPTCTAR